MSLSDCAKCWDTPCTCGHEYRNYSDAARIQLGAAALNIPQAVVKEFYDLFHNAVKQEVPNEHN